MITRVEWLAQFGIGERRYVETTKEKYKGLMHGIWSDAVRLRLLLYKRNLNFEIKFKTNLFTAVPQHSISNVRYIVCVERIQ